ncbi:MAG: hypothetical protein MJK18_01870 [Bdellovibrionales bacterium]|nr:hypothetical protein [Bdellovibrionales bacterium]
MHQWLISLILILTFQEAFSQPLCSKVFEVPYVKGILLKSSKVRDIYFIGEGLMGGKVFRIFDHRTGRSTLYKEYKTEWALKNDIHALRLLKRLVSRHNNEVQINEPLKSLDGKTLEFPDVKGHTLFRHPDLKSSEIWNFEFVFWVAKIRAEAENQGFTIRPMGPDMLWMEFSVPKNRRAEFDGLEKINFFLKPDNVIVESFTGQMVIFDPM